MAEEEDAKNPSDDQENAEFAAGFDDKPAPERSEKPTAKADKPTAGSEVPEPSVQISRKEWEEIRAAALKIPSYDSQLSRAFGTIGKLKEHVQKLLDGQAATAPAATRKVEIPKTAFEAMARDFPELAEHNRAALEAALSGLKLDANDIDDGKIEKVMAGLITKKEMEGLEETYPDWRTIVGAPTPESDGPDLGKPYRQWLATKDAEYQAKLNATESPAVIQRSIALFRRETRTAPKPAAEKPREAVRADRIRAAVQPRGDGAAATPGRSDVDEFEAGFREARG